MVEQYHDITLRTGDHHKQSRDEQASLIVGRDATVSVAGKTSGENYD